MTQVHIVGGGLAGATAALKAAQTGARSITLHEMGPALGARWSRKAGPGRAPLELADGFGPPRSILRSALAEAGVTFQDHARTLAAISPAPGGGVCRTEGAANPTLVCHEAEPMAVAGERLVDHINALPRNVRAPVMRFAQWRLGGWIDDVHATGASALGLDRILPLEGRHARPAQDPASAQTISWPTADLDTVFRAIGRRLDQLGVRLRLAETVSPAQAMELCAEDARVLWCAPVEPLMAEAGLRPPGPASRLKHVYTFRFPQGPAGSVLMRAFLPEGVAFAFRIIGCGTERLLSVECARPAEEATIRADVARKLALLGLASAPGELIAVETGPDPRLPTVNGLAARQNLGVLLGRRLGGRFILAPEAGDLPCALAGLGKAAEGGWPLALAG